MSGGGWAWVVSVVLVVVGLAYLIGDARAQTRAWSNGYIAGQRAERSVTGRPVRRMALQARTAERDIGDLYERARREIGQYRSDAPPGEARDLPMSGGE